MFYEIPEINLCTLVYSAVRFYRKKHIRNIFSTFAIFAVGGLQRHFLSPLRRQEASETEIISIV